MSRIQRIIEPDRQQMKTTGMIFLLIGCITAILWVSSDKFLRVQDSQDKVKTTMELNQQVWQLQTQYHDAKPETLEADLEQANQLLIQNFTHLAQWAQRLQQQGNQWNLQMQYRILKAKQTPSSVAGLMVVPLEIQISQHGTASAYRSYLQFLQTLEQSGPRIDIQEVTVMGDGKKATQLTVGLSVWMKSHDSVEL